MRSLIQKLAARLRKNQAGFTLVELLVVVGIIVALGAVIVPNVIQFADEGTTGAQASEASSLQTAIDTYMADQTPPLIALPAADYPAALANGSNDFSAAGVLDLTTGNYLRNATTQFWYCWNDTGLITQQFTTAALAAGAC
ncbi:MAG: type II secretion system GspH family protein [Chloroflexi bacterium]|nr:type II secretion system GspH family protein [Chloroflexota bacterium]